MAGESIYCTGCGITLMPFMKVCPRCGAVRKDAKPLEPPPPHASAFSEPDLETAPLPEISPAVTGDDPTVINAAATQSQTDVVPLNAIRQQRVPEGNANFTPTRDMVFLSPTDIQRRFPLFTKAQLTLAAVGVSLLIILLIIAYLLWRQQKRDEGQAAGSQVVISQPSPAASATVDPSPTPTPPLVDDQTISEAVKSALTAYNPLGFTRYKYEVKEGVVTLSGEAEHQPEKDGAENVIKFVVGVKSVVNNLKVKPDDLSLPVKVNAAEARILDEALRRQIQTDDPGRTEPPKPTQSDPQREAERQRRELAAARQREEELTMRKAAEDKLKREAEEFEKRQEELRRIESERRTRAEQAKLEVSALRSGTAAWNGIVDGVDEIIFSGGSASVRHINGNPPREVRASLSAPIPRSPVSVKLISTNGRGPIQIIQQPSAANGYTTIVRVDDSGKGGERRYEFTLRWALQ
jgi:hypothetical protein